MVRLHKNVGVRKSVRRIEAVGCGFDEQAVIRGAVDRNEPDIVVVVSELR